MKVNKFLLITTLIFVMLIASWSVWGADDDVLKTRIRLGQDITTMDPAHAVSEYDIDLLLYSRLVRYEEGSSELINDAAEEIEINDEGTVISFKLKEGIQFHKGYGEMTAEDVKFSFERIIDPEEKSEYASDWKTLDHVEVTGKYTGKIILKKPFAPLLVTTLPFTPGSIVSKKAYEDLGKKYATKPVGSGPYYWEEWKPEQHIILSRFDKYFGNRADFKKIKLFPISDKKVAEMNFDRGDLDVTEIALDSIDRYKNNSETDVHVLSALKYTFIGFNHEMEPFDNLKVRQAVRYALDIDEIIAGAFNNIPKRAKTMIPQGILGHWEDAPLYEQDLKKARQLLAEAGYGDGLTTTINTVSKPVYMSVSQIMQQQLQDAGIEANIHVIESGSGYPFLGKESHPGLFYYAFSLTLDPGYWVEWFTSDQVGKWNFLKWSNEEYDRLADEAALCMDPEKRAEMYVEMQRIMDEESAIIWLTHGAKVYVSDKTVDPAFLGHYNQYRYWEKE